MCRYLQKLCQVFLSPFDAPFIAVGVVGSMVAASFGRGRQSFADALPHGRYVEIPGNHMNAVTRKELGAAMVDFLTA